MSQTISFTDYTPPARYDSLPWTHVQVQESDTATLSDTTVWTVIDTQALSPLDSDPSLPASRNVTTSNASDTPALWYRLVWVDAATSTSPPTTPVENLPLLAAYASTGDLFRVLKVRTPSAAQVAAAQRDLDTATLEIDTELDRAADAPAFTHAQLQLVRDVCVDRAADLWRHRESAAGILGIPDETVASPQPMRYAWTRYAQRLSPLKEQFGLA